MFSLMTVSQVMRSPQLRWFAWPCLTNGNLSDWRTSSDVDAFPCLRYLPFSNFALLNWFQGSSFQSKSSGSLLTGHFALETRSRSGRYMNVRIYRSNPGLTLSKDYFRCCGNAILVLLLYWGLKNPFELLKSSFENNCLELDWIVD